MNFENRTIQQQAERIKTLEAAVEAAIREGEIRAWDHESTSPRLRELMKKLRAAVMANT